MGDRSVSALLDEADRLSARMALRYDRHARGGEHDAVRHLGRRARRALAGAGYLNRRGEHPDVLADVIRAHTPGELELSDDDLVVRWCRLILAGLAERRTARRRARRRRLHLAAGHPTEYAYRTAQAAAAGYGSLWQWRKARGWT
jgi:hypothetical protein